MARPDTIEHRKLSGVRASINNAILAVGDHDVAKLTLLEYVSCKYSGISIDSYYEITGYLPAFEPEMDAVEDVCSAISVTGIPFALALSSLARIEMCELDVKKRGSVYTDFRLASYLAQSVMCEYVGGAIVDPSCGTSILLAACAEYVRRSRGDVAKFVSSSLCGVDFEPHAIRGSILALASLVDDALDLKSLTSHFICGDSLMLRTDIASAVGVDGFAYVVGNPPWERVRPSRNEYARECGISVGYGEAIRTLPDGYEGHRDARRARSMAISATYGLKGGIDLYRAFLSLSMEICSDGGTIALFLPAGLIRSKSLARTRRELVDGYESVVISVFMNRAKFFSIDSRFKFVLATLSGKRNGACIDHVRFRYCDANDDSVSIDSNLRLNRGLFCDASNELGAPEVKTQSESKLLLAIWNTSERMTEHGIFSGVLPVRELDMTLDRSLFKKAIDDDNAYLPLIEGRMVSPFRCGCKQYLSGEGRSAKWVVVPPGSSRIEPQFLVAEDDLDASLRERVHETRVGFCDIAGQTNERAMQAALIPPGCVCGNKVPTLLFPSEDAAYLWLGLANSFVFDWVVRRYITTTINFFVLENLPFPRLELHDEIASSIIKEVRQLIDLEDGDAGWDRAELWDYACKRARLDTLSLRAYGLNMDDFELIASDFPLVDRVNSGYACGQKPTFDLVRYYLSGNDDQMIRSRCAWENGAMPYVPNEQMRNLISAR